MDFTNIIDYNLLLQCWLKKQKDPLAPDKQEAGDNTIWTSGLIFGKNEGQNCPLWFFVSKVGVHSSVYCCYGPLCQVFFYSGVFWSFLVFIKCRGPCFAPVYI
ncbi:hypothetical protein LXL04_028738 [Taraxacum kok-saghyz]